MLELLVPCSDRKRDVGTCFLCMCVCLRLRLSGREAAEEVADCCWPWCCGRAQEGQKRLS